MSKENNNVSDMRVSTENNRSKKAERREAKTARKEANKVEEKKSRPNNVLLAWLIFGVLAGMFVFTAGYRYYQRPASIEKYVNDNGIAEMYKDAPISEYTTMTIGAEGNTLKMWFKVAEDAPDEEVNQYKGEEGEEALKDIGSYYLASIKPMTRGLSGTVKMKAAKGDETLCYVKMTHREAKKYIKEAQKKAEEEAAAAEEAETTEDAEQAEGVTVEEDAAE